MHFRPQSGILCALLFYPLLALLARFGSRPGHFAFSGVFAPHLPNRRKPVYLAGLRKIYITHLRHFRSYRRAIAEYVASKALLRTPHAVSASEWNFVRTFILSPFVIYPLLARFWAKKCPFSRTPAYFGRSFEANEQNMWPARHFCAVAF